MSIPTTKLTPGEELRQILQELLPNDRPDHSAFGSRLDLFFIADGDLSELIYQSCINYMLRRLVTTAEFLRRKYDVSDYSSGYYIVQIRKYLRDYTRLPNNKIELVLVLLLACIEERSKVPSETLRRQIRNRSRDRNLGCYICGRTMDYSTEGQHDSFELEHKWPRSLGGNHMEDNLAAACHKCNHEKSEFIDASDFHYEEICLVSEQTSSSFQAGFPWSYRVALWAKSQYQCCICGKQASEVGQLQFHRRDPNDSWHFLNVVVYCDRHAPR